MSLELFIALILLACSMFTAGASTKVPIFAGLVLACAIGLILDDLKLIQIQWK